MLKIAQAKLEIMGADAWLAARVRAETKKKTKRTRHLLP
jgi:hypothetical protein